MDNENKYLTKLKGIDWTSRSVVIAITVTVFGILLLGIGQFFTLQSKPDASLWDYVYSIALFSIVVIAVPNAYSVIGKTKGLADKKLQDTVKENTTYFEEVGKKNWEEQLEAELERDNQREKLMQLKTEIFNKIAKSPDDESLRKLKSQILRYYNYRETNDKTILLELQKDGFDLDTFSVAYEHIEYNDLFNAQSSGVSKRKRKLNIESMLLKESIIKRGVVIVFGGYVSAYALIFGFSFLSLLMFAYQIALVAWVSFSTFNRAYNLVVVDLLKIIQDNNVFLKVFTVKQSKADEVQEKLRTKEAREKEEQEKPAKERERRIVELEEKKRKRAEEIEDKKMQMAFEIDMKKLDAEIKKAEAEVEIAHRQQLKDLQESSKQSNKLDIFVTREDKK